MYPTPPSPEATSKISRIVAFVLTPLILIAATAVANEAQTVFNYNLDGAELAVFLSSIILPVGGAIGVWLLNRGKYEIEKVKATDPVLGGLIQNAVDESINRALEAADKPGANFTGPGVDQPPPTA